MLIFKNKKKGGRILAFLKKRRTTPKNKEQNYQKALWKKTGKPTVQSMRLISRGQLLVKLRKNRDEKKL